MLPKKHMLVLLGVKVYALKATFKEMIAFGGGEAKLPKRILINLNRKKNGIGI